MADIVEPKIVTPKDEREIRLEVQREFVAMYKIEPYDMEQKIYKGKIIPTSRVGPWAGLTDRDWVFFSRRYEPENNDLDKVFVEEKYGPEMTGYEFTLIPGNKIRMFYVPESSVIKLAHSSSKVLV
jgi:hypothetical protein